jgi:hypothetical protein
MFQPEFDRAMAQEAVQEHYKNSREVWARWQDTGEFVHDDFIYLSCYLNDVLDDGGPDDFVNDCMNATDDEAMDPVVAILRKESPVRALFYGIPQRAAMFPG